MQKTATNAGRAMRGRRNHHAGLMAEDGVADHYMRQGGTVLARRWRGAYGEIDLIIRRDDMVVFVEVKAARHHEQAAWRLGRQQAARIHAAALEYCAGVGDVLMPMRFDLALVDAYGRIEVIENALFDM